MATETSDRRQSHLRGLTVTTLAATAGIAAGLASSAVAGLEAGSNTALAILAAAVIVQFPVLQALGVDVEDFSAKDYLYVAFMTFALWFVSWGILLTTGTTI